VVVCVRVCVCVWAWAYAYVQLCRQLVTPYVVMLNK